MASDGRFSELKWMGVGMAALAALIAVVTGLRSDTDPAHQLAVKATRIDLVAQLEGAIARSAEAARSAVLSTSDAGSQAFADQARARLAEADQALGELGRLGKGSPAREQPLQEAFSGAFLELKTIDEEVLGLAVQNTNLKASALAFGPAAQALAELEAPLTRLAEQAAGSTEGRQVLLHALGARIAALHVQILLAPHIAEESDAGMDRLEAAMLAAEVQARQEVAALQALPALKGSSEVAAAAAALARYAELKTRILALSRQNTNVRSLALSLNQERKAMATCLDALAALKQAILDEPIPGVSYGKAGVPRR